MGRRSSSDRAPSPVSWRLRGAQSRAVVPLGWQGRGWRPSHGCRRSFSQERESPSLERLSSWPVLGNGCSMSPSSVPGCHGSSWRCSPSESCRRDAFHVRRPSVLVFCGHTSRAYRSGRLRGVSLPILSFPRDVRRRHPMASIAVKRGWLLAHAGVGELTKRLGSGFWRASHGRILAR